MTISFLKVPRGNKLIKYVELTKQFKDKTTKFRISMHVLLFLMWIKELQCSSLYF